MTDPGPPGQPYGDYQPQGGWPPPNPYGEQSPYGAPDPYGPYGSPPPQYGQQPSYQQPQYEQPQYQQPQYQQPSYQQQPGYEQPAYQQSPYQPAPYGAPPPKKGGSGLLIGAIVGVALLVLALCGVGVWALARNGSNTTTTTTGTTPAVPTGTARTTPGTARTTAGATSTDPSDATVGSCLAGDTLDSSSAKPVNDISIVDCSSGRAKYKVVGIVRNITESRFNTDDHICDAYPSAKSALWQGTASSGEVLCLAPVK